MSEHQYYEFRAVDRPLDKREMEELRDLSSRAEITPTSFVNVYNYGDFRGDPHKLMEKYFDAFVYSANWGTRRVILRVPRGLIDVEAIRPYCVDESAALHLTKEHAVLAFRSDNESEGWQTDDEDWLPSLLPLREDLIAGDLRCLYLGWLIGVQGGVAGELDDDEPEPPVPPELGKLSPALESFADFLQIDSDLIEIAAKHAAGAAPAGPSHDDLAAWIAALPGSEKNALLLRLATEKSSLLRREILHRFRQARAPAGRGRKPAPSAPPRTAGQLRAALEGHAEEERRRETERLAEEQAQRDREKAEARTRRLDELSRREAQGWKEVERMIQTKLPKEYDRAVELLTDLRDLAQREGRKEEAAARLAKVHERHARKTTFIQRLKRACLLA